MERTKMGLETQIWDKDSWDTKLRPTIELHKESGEQYFDGILTCKRPDTCEWIQCTKCKKITEISNLCVCICGCIYYITFNERVWEIGNMIILTKSFLTGKKGQNCATFFGGEKHRSAATKISALKTHKQVWKRKNWKVFSGGWMIWCEWQATLLTLWTAQTQGKCGAWYLF